MCDIPDIYRSVCRSVVWWCWAMINVLYWLETVETSPSLPGSSLLLCVVWTLWTGPVFTISHVLTAGKPQTRNKWINFTKHFICPISYSCLRQSGLWMRPHWPQTHTWRLVHSHLRCWRHCSQLTFTKVSAHFCFLIFRLSIFCPCPKKYDFKWLKNDLLTRIVINQTVWMLWILLVESGGWCGMGCVCIARCCTVWRMSGQEMTFDCIMSPLTTNTAGSSAAATWGQLLRRRGSCWW